MIMHAEDVHVHIHFSQPGGGPTDSAGGAAEHRPGDYHRIAGHAGAAHGRGIEYSIGPYPSTHALPPEASGTSAATVFAPGVAAPDPCFDSPPGPGGGLPPPLQLPLQPLTRLVAFDDALADLVSEVDTLLESQSGRHGGALREPSRGAVANYGGAADEDCWGMQRLKEWVSGQTGACMDARVARGASDSTRVREAPFTRACAAPGGGRQGRGDPLRDGIGERDLEGGHGMHAAGRLRGADAPPQRRRGAVETHTLLQHPAGRPLGHDSRPVKHAGQRSDGVDGDRGRDRDGGPRGAHAAREGTHQSASAYNSFGRGGRPGHQYQDTSAPVNSGAGGRATTQTPGDAAGVQHPPHRGHRDHTDARMYDHHAYAPPPPGAPWDEGGDGGRDVHEGWADVWRGGDEVAARGGAVADRVPQRGTGRTWRHGAEFQARGDVDAQDAEVLTMLNDLF